VLEIIKGCIHQQIGLKYNEETSKMICLEHSLYGAETWALGKVDQLDLSCET
jgi:hypothetical protein